MIQCHFHKMIKNFKMFSACLFYQNIQGYGKHGHEKREHEKRGHGKREHEKREHGKLALQTRTIFVQFPLYFNLKIKQVI